MPWAEGPSFTITIEGSATVLLRVRRNAALSRTEGAAAAEQMASHLLELVKTQHALLLDLTQATTTRGPQTDTALLRMLAPWEAKGLPTRIVCADEPIQIIAAKSVLARAAPKRGALAETVRRALASVDATPKSAR